MLIAVKPKEASNRCSAELRRAAKVDSVVLVNPSNCFQTALKNLIYCSNVNNHYVSFNAQIVKCNDAIYCNITPLFFPLNK